MNSFWQKHGVRRKAFYINWLWAAPLLFFACGGGGSQSYLADGEIGRPVPLDFKNGQLELSLASLEGKENFVLVLFNTETEGQIGVTDIVVGDQPAQQQSKTARLNVTNAPVSYHENLLSAGARLLELGLPRAPSQTAPLDAPTAPTNKTFKLLRSFSEFDHFDQFEATLITASDRSAFYADLRGDRSWYDDPAFAPAMARLQLLYDNYIVPNNRSLFGMESDIDGFPPVYILLSPALHQLGAIYDGQLRGFFYSGDLIPPDPHNNAASNGTEILYLATPNPLEFSASTPMHEVIEQSVEHNMPGTLAHELQHLINFNERVLVRGYTEENRWLNEALSHLAEGLNGFDTANGGRAGSYLHRPHLTSLTSGADSLPQRGGNYLMLRHLANQSGMELSELTSRMVTEKARGAKKFGKVFDLNYSEILGNFSLALWFDTSELPHDPLFSIGPMHTLNAALNFMAQTQSIETLFSPLVLPLNSGSMQIAPTEINYLFFSAKDKTNFTITIDSRENDDLGGYLVRLPDGKDGKLLDN